MVIKILIEILGDSEFENLVDGARVMPRTYKVDAERSEKKIHTEEKLVNLAITHRVTYQVLQYARQHQELFPEKQRQRLEDHVRQNAVRSLMQLHELVRIAAMLNGQGISWACIKGPQLSRMLYGREALKESVDLDLMLLDRVQLGMVHQALKEMGYGHSNLDVYRTGLAKKLFLLAKREVHYFNVEKGVHLDLHVRAAANAYLTISRHRRLFRELVGYEIEGTPVPILPHEEYLNFLCHHGALHQFGSLGWLLDVRYFIRMMKEELGTDRPGQVKEELNGDRVRKVARELRTERSLLLSLVLLKELFGDEMPVLVHRRGGQGWRSKKDSLDNQDWKLKYLVRSCRRRWSMDAAASLSWRGRLDRFLYLMVLSEGIAAKADVVIGVLIRNLLPLMRLLHL